MCEAGIVGTGVTWSLVQQRLADRHGLTSYSYDRRGLGRSAALAPADTLAEMVADLRGVVEAHTIPPPIVLVAHSFGALIALAYVERYASDVRGLVLVDPLAPAEWHPATWTARLRLRRTRTLAWLGGWCARLGLVRLGLWGLLRRGHGRAGPILGLSPTMRRLAREVAKIPSEEVRQLQALWTDPRFFRTLGHYTQRLPALTAEAARVRMPSDVPVMVLSGAHQPEDVLALHRQLSRSHRVVPNSGHWIPFDDPDAVAEAVARIISS